jgi:hypothetical protein
MQGSAVKCMILGKVWAKFLGALPRSFNRDHPITARTITVTASAWCHPTSVRRAMYYTISEIHA